MLACKHLSGLQSLVNLGEQQLLVCARHVLALADRLCKPVTRKTCLKR